MRKDGLALTGLGIFYVVIGNILFGSVSYTFNYSVGYAIFLVVAGFEASRTLKSIKLNSSKNALRSTVLNMIYKIVSSHELVLLLCLITVFIVHNGWTLKTLVLKSLYSIFCASNFESEATPETAFERRVLGTDLFEHTWLISIYVQGILIMAFIFVMSKNLIESKRKIAEIGLVSTFAIASFIDFCLLHDSSRIFAVSRFWQFGIGILAAVFIKPDPSNKEAHPSNNDPLATIKVSKGSDGGKNVTVVDSVPSWLLPLQAASLAVCFLFFAPFSMEPAIAEIIVTVATTVLMVTGCTKPLFLLDNQYAAFPGKIALTVYIVHWPVLTFVRHFSLNGMFPAESVVGFVIPLVLAISLVVYFFFARPLEKIHEKKRYIIFIVIIVLILLNVSLMVFSSMLAKMFSAARERAYAENQKFVERDYTIHGCKQLPLTSENITAPYGYCAFDEGVGSLRILLVGDLFSVGDARPLFDSFSSKHGELRVLSAKNFAPLMPISNTEAFRQFMQITTDYLPDVVIIDQDFKNQRVPPAKTSDPRFPWKDDHILQSFRRTVNTLLQMGVSKVLVAGTRPNAVGKWLDKLQTTLEEEDGPIEQYSWRAQALRMQAHNVLRRINNINKQKVEYIEVMDVLNVKGIIRMYDSTTMVSLFDNNLVFTDRGAELARPFYRRIVDRILAHEREVLESEKEEAEETSGEPIPSGNSTEKVETVFLSSTPLPMSKEAVQ